MRNSVATLALAATAMACSGKELPDMSDAEALALAKLILGHDAPPADPQSFCQDLYTNSYFRERLLHAIWHVDDHYQPSTAQEFRTEKKAIIPGGESDIEVTCHYKKRLKPNVPDVRYDMPEQDQVLAASGAVLSSVEKIYFGLRDPASGLVQAEFSDNDADGKYDGASSRPGNKGIFPATMYNMQVRYRQIVDEASRRLETNDLLPEVNYHYRVQRR